MRKVKFRIPCVLLLIAGMPACAHTQMKSAPPWQQTLQGSSTGINRAEAQAAAETMARARAEPIQSECEKQGGVTNLNLRPSSCVEMGIGTISCVADGAVICQPKEPAQLTGTKLGS